MNVLDIKNNLQTKLNIAITNEITSKQANGQFTPLESDRETYRFKLFLDTADYQGYDYLKRGAVPNENGEFDDSAISEFPTAKYVNYLNGVIEIVDSNVEGGINITEDSTSADPTNLTFTADVVFFVPLTSMPDADTMELIGTIRTIIDNAMRLNTYADFNGYNMSVVYSLGRTGEREIRKGVGDSITLSCAIQYAFVEGGINSTQISVKYGNTVIYAPTKALSRIASQEANVDLETDNNASKNVTLSTVFTLSFDTPLTNGDFGDIATEFLLDGDTGTTYSIDVTIGEKTRTMQMSFNEVAVSAQNTLNAGLAVKLVEALEVENG